MQIFEMYVFHEANFSLPSEAMVFVVPSCGTMYPKIRHRKHHLCLLYWFHNTISIEV